MVRSALVGLRLNEIERRELYRQAGELGQSPQNYLRDFIKQNQKGH